MRAYKYLQSIHLDSFLEGNVRLNTFSNIRRHEEGKLIADPDEGVVKHDVGGIRIDDSEENSENLAIFKSLGSPNIVFAEGAGIDFGSNAQLNVTLDAYMFCVTAGRNDKYWKEEEKYDACILIKDFHKFTSIIAANIHIEIARHQNCKCTYEINQGSFLEKKIVYPNFFRKLPKFEIQRENRGVFIPKILDGELDPISINMELKNLCEVVWSEKK